MRSRADAVRVDFTLTINGTPMHSSVLVPLDLVIANPRVLQLNAADEARKFWKAAVLMGLLDERKGIK